MAKAIKVPINKKINTTIIERIRLFFPVGLAKPASKGFLTGCLRSGIDTLVYSMR